jgi:hypothetical protein
MNSSANQIPPTHRRDKQPLAMANPSFTGSSRAMLENTSGTAASGREYAVNGRVSARRKALAAEPWSWPALPKVELLTGAFRRFARSFRQPTRPIWKAAINAVSMQFSLFIKYLPL